MLEAEAPCRGANLNQVSVVGMGVNQLINYHCDKPGPVCGLQASVHLIVLFANHPQIAIFFKEVHTIYESVLWVRHDGTD